MICIIHSRTPCVYINILILNCYNIYISRILIDDLRIFHLFSLVKIIMMFWMGKQFLSSLAHGSLIKENTNLYFYFSSGVNKTEKDVSL